MMTLLNMNSGHSDPSYIWAAIRSFGAGFLKLVNRWVAAILAQRAHQANLAVLRRLDERQLRDIGIDRGEIDAASPDAIRDRALRRHAMLS
jgi:uncharacterized protein YjiS (DUF1127 family)